jgi:hypothetical protein
MLRIAVGRKPRRSDGEANRRNAIFRRERESRRWSREALATWADDLAGQWGYQGSFTGDQIYRIEEDDVVPDPWRQQVLAALFELLPEQLGFPAPPAVLTNPPSRLDAAALLVAASHPVDSDEMRRREFSRVLALLAGGVLAGDIDFERLMAVLQGARPDALAIDGLQALTNDLMGREATVAPHVLLPEVRGHLQGLQDVLTWTPPSLDSRLSSVAGQTALLAGYLMFKRERVAEADTYWSIADHLADRAGDRRLRGILLQLQSWRQEGENPALSLALLNHAESLLGSRPDAASAALLLTRRALRYAPLIGGDSSYLATAMRDVEAAQEHLGRLGPAATRLYVFENVADEAMTMRALALASLPSRARREEAAADLERVLGSVPIDSLSWRAYAAADLAAVRANVGDPEGAAVLLGDALQYAAQAHAVRCFRWVRTCSHQVLTQYRELPAVRRLNEQMLALPDGA